MAASGAGYYLYSRSTNISDSDKPGSSSGSSAGKKSKKSKKKKNVLKGEGTEGPLLEEIDRPAEKGQSPKVEGQETASEKVEDKSEGPTHLAGKYLLRFHLGVKLIV